MKRFFKIASLTLLMVAALCLGGGAMASANDPCANDPNPLACACSAGGNSNVATACSTDGSINPISGPNGILKKVTLLLGLVSGIAAVIMIIISGFRFVTADGDAQKAASARNGIIGSVIGLGIIVLSTTIVIFVASKL